MYRQRFGLTHHPFPQDAQGARFSPIPSYQRLARRFAMLLDQPGVGLLTAEAGVGKTSAIRNLCSALPRPDYHVSYLCDTSVSPLEVYRTLALEFGVLPSHRRSQLWHDLKEVFIHKVDEQGVRPVLVVDEAQHLSERFLKDLSGFLNFAMDSRSLLTLWLVAQPPLLAALRAHRHAALATRLVARIHLEPLTDPKEFKAFFDHGMKAAGATQSIFTDAGKDLLHRTTRGLPRRIAYLVREALMLAHEHDKSFVDDSLLEEILDEEQWS